MKNTSTVKIASIVISMFSLCFAFSPIANAEWYDVKVIAVAPKVSTGDTAVQIQDADPTGSLDHFSGIQRCWVFSGQPGSNAVLASLLTAVSLNSVVLMNIPGVPTWNNGLVCESVGVKPAS